jgi:hypothetical protein
MAYNNQLFARERPSYLNARTLVQGCCFALYREQEQTGSDDSRCWLPASSSPQSRTQTLSSIVLCAAWKPVSLIAQVYCQHRHRPLAHGLSR